MPIRLIILALPIGDLQPAFRRTLQLHSMPILLSSAKIPLYHYTIHNIRCSRRTTKWCHFLPSKQFTICLKLTFSQYPSIHTISIDAQNANPDITINIELAKINEWLEINKLSINFFLKSKFMIFHTHSKNAKAVVPSINNTNLEKVEQFQFLGLTLDSNLNWKKTKLSNFNFSD